MRGGRHAADPWYTRNAADAGADRWRAGGPADGISGQGPLREGLGGILCRSERYDRKTMTRAADEIGRAREQEQISRSVTRVMDGEQEVPDQLARDEAAKNEARQDKHEAVCTERWQQSKEGLARVELVLGTVQKAMNDRIGKIPASIIAAMTGIIGFLAARAWPIH